MKLKWRYRGSGKRQPIPSVAVLQIHFPLPQFEDEKPVVPLFELPAKITVVFL